jgi:hypothetical protein
MTETVHQGGCHCGKVRFEATTDLAHVISCNCSICTKHGLLLTFLPATKFKLLDGEEQLEEYRFNKGRIRHTFCRECGVETFGRGKHPEGFDMVALNVRCLDDIDLARLNPVPFDGKSV